MYVYREIKIPKSNKKFGVYMYQKNYVEKEKKRKSSFNEKIGKILVVNDEIIDDIVLNIAEMRL